MPLSFRNMIDTSQLADALTTGDFSKVIKKKNQNIAKYIKGYAEDTAIEALANATNTNSGLIKQAFGLENKEIDNYDPYHTSDAKKEDFWNTTEDISSNKGLDGKAIQQTYDEDTNTFKRGLYSNKELGGYRQNDFWYEDPFYPSFELFFHEDSPFFTDKLDTNGILSFIDKYTVINNEYIKRKELWTEFNKVFFKIFEKSIEQHGNRNFLNKVYYITKIGGLNNLNKKMINYGEDKLSITLNEDVGMFAYYISELYNNLVYSYRNQRFMFPENVLRFDLTIKINDIRKFQIPESSNSPSENIPNNPDKTDNKNVKNVIAPETYILYTLHDCTFNFFESRNYGDDIEIGGYGSTLTYTPQNLTFNIIYKSVTRSSKFPLIRDSFSIDAWESPLYSKEYTDGTLPQYMDNLNRINNENVPENKGYLNQLLAKGAQTVVSTAANYVDNLETRLREVRGSAVNGLLNQFRNTVNINKIEPDNVYNTNFNDRTSVINAGKQVASNLLNDLENTARKAASF